MRARAAAAALLALLLPLCAGAEPAAPDSALHGFLGGLADSTDRYFGVSAAPLDTTGLDSALAARLASPLATRSRTRLDFDLGPDFGFNRVDGPVYGMWAGLGDPRPVGRIEGQVHYAAGPNVWLGGGGIRKALGPRDAPWRIRVFAGRLTEVMDREASDLRLSHLRALVTGSDDLRYYRRDGLETSFGRESESWLVEAGYRDMLESPLVTTATWNFFDRRLAVRDNLPAARGRVHELSYRATAVLPLAPVTAEITHATAGQAIGSDFEYRRTRVALAADLGLGRFAALVPQLSYGRLSGAAVPQASFYLGGAHSLRSVEGESIGGTGAALARLDLIGADDLLALARLPHPAAIPLQGALFAAAGAVWGVDPYGGRTLPGVDWPHREDWLTEAGVGLLWRPGLPDPLAFLEFSYAWPLGPADRDARYAITYTRALDLVHSLGE